MRTPSHTRNGISIVETCWASEAFSPATCLLQPAADMPFVHACSLARHLRMLSDTAVAQKPIDSGIASYCPSPSAWSQANSVIQVSAAATRARTS